MEKSSEENRRVSSKITELRKSGQIDEAIALARDSCRDNPGDFLLQSAYGWCLWALLKTAEDTLSIGRLLSDYRTLTGVHRSDVLHSQILNATLKRGVELDEFIGFVKWWDLSKLRREDFIPFEKDGKSYPCLATKVLGALCKNLKTHEQARDDIEWIIEFFENKIDKLSYDWVPYWFASLLGFAGRDGETVRAYLLSIVRKKDRHFWAWQKLGDTYSDVGNRLDCYCKGYDCDSQNFEYAVGFYISFVGLLADVKECEVASELLKQLVERKAEFGRVSVQKIEHLERLPWYSPTGSSTLREFCKSRKQNAELLLIEDLPKAYAVIDHLNASKQLAWFVMENDNEGPLSFKKWPNATNLLPGNLIEVTYEEIGVKDDMRTRVLDWDLIEPKVVPNLYRAFSGALVRPPNRPFGFVSDSMDSVFVPPELIEATDCCDGSICEGWAYRKFDNRKQLDGWRAAIIKETT